MSQVKDMAIINKIGIQILTCYNTLHFWS